MVFGIEHLIESALAGGALTPIVQIGIAKVKGKGNWKDRLYKKIDDHAEEDKRAFARIDQTYTDILLPMKENIAYIKGALDEKKTKTETD
jgi:hypothetical protein